MGLERLTGMGYLNPAPWHLRPVVRGDVVAPSQAYEGAPQEEILSQNVPPDSPLRRISAASADHFRAIPLSDGYHILFTDPNRGSLCLGTDAPVGSLTRLLCKVSFRPPGKAASPMPLLYAAGADTRHGVRVVATFAVGDGSPRLRRHAGRDPCLPVIDVSVSRTNQQLIVFYTVPPDVFHDMSRANSTSRSFGDYGLGEREHWLPNRNYGPIDYGLIDISSSSFDDSLIYPLEIDGQAVGIGNNLTELGLDSSSDLVIWAFSAEGWAKTWAINTGRNDQWWKTSVQPDGSIRHTDADGDVVMSDSPPLDMSPLEMSAADLNVFDGVAAQSKMDRLVVHEVQLQNRVEKTVSINIVEETSGITRVEMDVGEMR